MKRQMPSERWISSVRFSDVKQFYISILKEDREYEGWLPVVTVLLVTGMRIGECLGFCEEEIDGYSGFVFSTSRHTVYSAAAVNNAIHRAVSAYNKKKLLVP